MKKHTITSSYRIYSGDSMKHNIAQMAGIGCGFITIMCAFLWTASLIKGSNLKNNLENSWAPLSMFCVLPFIFSEILIVLRSSIENKEMIFAKFARTLPNSFNVYKQSYIGRHIANIFTLIAISAFIIIICAVNIFPADVSDAVRCVCCGIFAVMLFGFLSEITALIKNSIVYTIIFSISLSLCFVFAIIGARFIQNIFILCAILGVGIILNLLSIMFNIRRMKKEWTK